MDITTKDLARVCGVSRGTIDRALNNKPRISARTKERIIQTAKDLNYRPDLLARSLVKGKSMCIGVVVFDIRNRYFAQLVNSFEIEAKSHGYFVNITLQENDTDMERRLIDGLVARRVDGLLLCPANKGREFARFLTSLPIPVVVIGNMVARDIPFIGIDEEKAAFEAVELILSKGYERVIFICPPLEDRGRDNIYTHERRLKGFLNAMKKNGSLEQRVIDHRGYTSELSDLLRGSKSRTALFCSGDTFALDTLKYLRLAGFQVPRDVGIMGFDNTDILEYITPSLATVNVPLADMGTEAVRLLLSRLDGQSVGSPPLFPHTIIDGQTL